MAPVRPPAAAQERGAPWYADRANLLFYQDDQGRSHPVKSAADWARRVAHTRANMELVMGALPAPKDVMFGFPVTTAGGDYKIVEGLEIDAFSRECIDKTLAELQGEQDGVKHLL